MEKRIVITGVGFLNDWTAGMALPKNFVRLFSDKISRIPLEEVDFDAYIDTSLVRRADYISRCALTAAKFALEDAGLLTVCNEKSDKIGIVVGTTHGALHYTVEYHISLVLGDPKLASPIFFSDSVPNAITSHISTALGIRGYATTVSGYCAVMQALQLGAELIQQGAVDVCLVGGADVNHDFLTKAYIGCLRNSESITETFGGSGFIVIESLAHALARRAKIYAQIEGVSIITAAYIAAKRYGISPLNELLCQGKVELNEHDCLLNASYDEEDSIKRRDLFLQAFKGVKFDCSDSFGYGFSAAEAFQLILGVLGVNSSDSLNLDRRGFLTPPKINIRRGGTGMSRLSSEKKAIIGQHPIERLFIMRTALAGANACALLSHYPAVKD